MKKCKYCGETIDPDQLGIPICCRTQILEQFQKLDDQIEALRARLEAKKNHATENEDPGVVEGCVRIHSAMSDGEGVEIRICRESQSGPRVEFYTISVPIIDGCAGDYEDVKHKFIAQTYDLDEVRRFLLATQRLLD